MNMCIGVEYDECNGSRTDGRNAKSRQLGIAAWGRDSQAGCWVVEGLSCSSCRGGPVRRENALAPYDFMS